MNRNIGRAALAASWLIASTAIAFIRTNEVHFVYQQNNEPWDTVNCRHQPAGNGSPYDWQVQCPVQAAQKNYLVHLALTLYPHTNPKGSSAYELLYWVTDNSNPENPRYASTTTWIQNSGNKDRIDNLEVGLGVEDGDADLKLNIQLANSAKGSS